MHAPIGLLLPFPVILPGQIVTLQPFESDPEGLQLSDARRPCGHALVHVPLAYGASNGLINPCVEDVCAYVRARPALAAFEFVRAPIVDAAGDLGPVL